MKVFLDANILFSASKSNSHMRGLVNLLSKKHSLVTSNYAHEEASRNLERKQKSWLGDLEKIMKNITVVDSCDLDSSIELAQKDRVILGSAIKSKCSFLVTGDKKDFRHLFGKIIKGVKVLTPSRIYEEIL